MSDIPQSKYYRIKFEFGSAMSGDVEDAVRITVTDDKNNSCDAVARAIQLQRLTQVEKDHLFSWVIAPCIERCLMALTGAQPGIPYPKLNTSDNVQLSEDNKKP